MTGFHVILIVFAACLLLLGIVAVAVIVIGARSERNYEEAQHGEDTWPR